MAAMYGFHPDDSEDSGYSDNNDSEQSYDTDIEEEEEREEEEETVEEIRERKCQELSELMKRVETMYEHFFYTNDETIYELFDNAYEEYQRRSLAYIQERYQRNFLHGFEYEWYDNIRYYEDAVFTRSLRKELGLDLSVKVYVDEEKERWFSSDRFLASSDYEDTYYDCHRSLYCGEYWCELHNTEKYHNCLVENGVLPFRPMYSDMVWEDLNIDEEHEDPEHEHHLFMFHTQDPAFHDELLMDWGSTPIPLSPMPGVSTQTSYDSDATYIDEDALSPYFSSYNPKPVISDESDSDTTFIEEGAF